MHDEQDKPRIILGEQFFHFSFFVDTTRLVIHSIPGSEAYDTR